MIREEYTDAEKYSSDSSYEKGKFKYLEYKDMNNAFYRKSLDNIEKVFEILQFDISVITKPKEEK
jgi:hypothetical protein